MAATRSYGDHILRRGNVYYFRQAVPCDLRERVGRSEVRISLRTAYLREARNKAKAMAGAGTIIFNRIREDECMDRAEIKRLVKGYFHEFLEDCEAKRIESGAKTLHDAVKGMADCRNISRTLHLDVLTQRYDALKNVVRIFADGHGIEVEDDTPLFNHIAHELALALRDAMSIMEHRLNGDYGYELPIMDRYKVETPIATVPPESPRKETDITFFQLVDRFCKFKITMKKWTGRGVKEQPKKFDIIKFILGDIPVSEINADTAMHVLECLQKLPPRLDAKRYAGKTVEEVMDMEHEKTLAIKTINLRMELMSGLFRYAEKTDFASKNYFSEMQLPDPENANEKKDPFTLDDLRIIFDPATFLPYCDGDETRYWMPILALYSGARIEELAQLEVDDVYVEDGILILDINDDGDKHLKTKSSKRLAPVHEFVRKELGFEAYVKRIKSSGEKHIFPNLSRVNTRRGHKPSRDFNRHLQRLCIEGKKSFHSFRHTFIDFLRNKGLSNSRISGVTGHKDDEDRAISDNYKKQLWLRFLVDEVMANVDYSPVIIAHFRMG